MRQRQVIVLSWRTSKMVVAAHEYHHPECLLMISPARERLAIVTVMQDPEGRACEISVEGVEKQVKAISPLDLHMGACCAACTQKVERPPVYENSEILFVRKEASL